MARGKALGFVCYIETPDRGPVAMCELTEAERAQWRQNALQRLSEDMSAYYRQNPEEYAAL